MVFAASSGDLWHEKLSRTDDIARVYAVMAYCQWHTFQVLTKRPEVRLRNHARFTDEFGEAFQRLLRRLGPPPHTKPFKWPLPNVWEGVSIENQATADERLPILLRTPAALRFVSYEPALGPVTFTNYLPGRVNPHWSGRADDAPALDWGLDWGIIGGESGPGARACNLADIEFTVDQFRYTGVPLFVKQLGSKPVRSAPGCLPTRYAITDSKGANWKEWPKKLRVREFPR